MLSILSMSQAQSLTPITNYQTNTANQCATPTVTKTVGVVIGQDAYNITKLSVPEGACVEIIFQDLDPSLAHSFTINADPTNSIALFNIYVDAGATGMSNFQAPNASITITYYCAVPGHYDSGMEGSMTVGSSKGGSSPGFELIPVFMGLFTVAAIATIYKKKN